MEYLKTLNELRKMKPNSRILDVEKLQEELDIITEYDYLVGVESIVDGDIISQFKINIKMDIDKPEYKMSKEEEKLLESLKWFNKNGLFDKNESIIIFRLGKDEDFISNYTKPDDKVFYTSTINGAYFPNYMEINKILKKYT